MLHGLITGIMVADYEKALFALGFSTRIKTQGRTITKQKLEVQRA